MDEMNEIGRFENSVEFLIEGLEGRMNDELKQMESALKDLKDADQRVQREIAALEDSGFEDQLNQANDVLEELAFEKHHHRSGQNQLTEQMIVQKLAEDQDSVLDIVGEMIDEIEGIEEDEETQLAEDIEAYETIEQSLQSAIDEHRAILTLKKDLKKAKQKPEFENHLREELNEINYDFSDIEELIQTVQQIQEESYEILKQIDDVIKDYREGLSTLGTEMQDILGVLKGGKRSTFEMAKRLRNHCEEKDLENGKRVSEELMKRISQLNGYTKSVLGLDQRIYRKLNSIENDLESYRDQYKAEENII